MKVRAQFTFHCDVEVKDGQDEAEIARTCRPIIQELLATDGIAGNITLVEDLDDDDSVDRVSDDIEEQ